MKRMIAWALAMALLLSLAGCSIAEKPQETNPTPTIEPTTEPTVLPTEPVEETVQPLEMLLGYQFLGEWSDNYVQLVQVSWQDLVLTPDCAGQYPALEQALLAYNRNTAAAAEETLADVLPDAEYQADWMGSDFYGYYHETAALVQRADNRILSVRSDYDAYFGGRPFHGTTMLNLDPETGKEIPLSAVVQDVNRLPALLKKALLAKYPELEAGAFDDIERILKAYDLEDYIWTLDYQGMTFFFGQAEIAPAVAGVLSATLWFDQYPDLFAAEFQEVPNQGYGRMLSQNSYSAADLNPGDGQRDTIFVSHDYEGNLYIHKNDQTLVNDNCFCYSAEAYLVSPDNKQFYLYVDTSADNDYSNLWIYDLSGDGIRFVTAVPGEGMAGFWYEEYPLGSNWFARVFNDPSCFEMSTRTDMLGTMTATRSYHMNPDNGVPVAETGYYLLDPDREPLVTKISLKLKLLPTQTEVEIPAGTRLWFVRTDGETYVDMCTADGKLLRVFVTYENWQGYVNGIPEHNCFEGIMYAG